MLPIETLATFLTAAVVLALVPGPDNVFVLTQSAVQGKGAGLAVVMGLCTGLIGHSTAVALGVAAIFQTSALAFTVLKYIGAAYLVYLAWQMFRAPVENIGEASGEIATDYGKLYLRGIIMNVTNPKVSIFFLAFLPQFTDPERGSVTIQILLLGGVFIGATIIVFGGIAVLAGFLGEWLNRSPRIQMVLNKLAATIFLGLALKLATTQR
jgi:threonine/homoserine/homoserine lactone efflux protein